MASWTRGITGLVLALALAGLLAAGCGGGGGADGGQAAGTAGSGGRLSLRIHRDGGVSRLLGVQGDEVHLAISSSVQLLDVALLDAENQPVGGVRQFQVDFGSDSPQPTSSPGQGQSQTQLLVVRELPVGNFLLKLLLRNLDGVPLSQFSTHVSLSAEQVTTVVATLTPISSPSPSPSSSPITGNVFVYVPNFTSGDISAYRFQSGTLTPLTGAPSGQGAHQLATSLDDRALFVTNSQVGTVRSFLIDPVTGALTAGDTENFGTFPTGIDVHPSLDVLYASDPSGNSVHFWNYDSLTGLLTPISSVAAANGPNDVSLNPAGTFAFTSDTNNNLSTFPVVTGGVLNTPPLLHNVPSSVMVRSIVVSMGANEFLYSTSQLTNGVQKHDIAVNGSLGGDQFHSLGSESPLGLAAHPTGNHLYVASLDGNIHVFDLLSNGTMVPNEVEAVGPNEIEAVAVDPTGGFLLATESITSSTGNLKVFTINPDGSITFTGNSAPTGESPADVLFATP